MHCITAYVFKAGKLNLSGVPHVTHEGFDITVPYDSFSNFLNCENVFEALKR